MCLNYAGELRPRGLSAFYYDSSSSTIQNQLSLWEQNRSGQGGLTQTGAQDAGVSDWENSFGWEENSGWEDNSGWTDNSGWEDNSGWTDNNGWTDNSGWETNPSWDNGGWEDMPNG